MDNPLNRIWIQRQAHIHAPRGAGNRGGAAAAEYRCARLHRRKSSSRGRASAG